MLSTLLSLNSGTWIDTFVLLLALGVALYLGYYWACVQQVGASPGFWPAGLAYSDAMGHLPDPGSSHLGQLA